MAGKGSTPRPIPDREQYAQNWDAIEWGTLEESDYPETIEYQTFDMAEPVEIKAHPE